MFRKVVYLVLTIVLCLSVSVYAEEEELSFVGRDVEISSLEDLAGKRLYVYGLLDNQMEEDIGIPILFLAEHKPIGRLDAVDMLYKLCMSEKDNQELNIPECSFVDVPDDKKEMVAYLVGRGIIDGVSDTEFGLSDCSLESFATMLLRYLEIEGVAYNDSVEKLSELGLLEYVTLENGFTRGDAYLILSNLLDLEKGEATVIDTLVFENKREEIKIPKTIDIYVDSYFDFIKKLDAAYFFAPDKINITLLDSCSEVEAYLIYNFLLKEDYSWSGLFDSFYDISSVYSYTGTGWIIHFSEYFEEHWRLSEDERTKEAVEISKELDSLYEKGVFAEYGDLAKDYRDYLEDLVRFSVTSDKKEMSIRTNSFNDSVYLNIDTLDWVRCYNKPEFTESIKNCSKDMEQFRDLSDYEKVNKVHDYICRKATYDYNEYYGMMRDDYKYADAHEVKGFITDGRIVCDGYAYTYQWLLDYLDVESIVVYGTSTIQGGKEGHAWNKVRLDDKWYNVDVCWADTGEGRQYFLKSDDYFESHYHIFEEDFLLSNLRADSNYTK